MHSSMSVADRGGKVSLRQHGRKAKFRSPAGRTDAGLFGRRALVTLVALAVVRSGRVDTVPVDTGVTHTLVHIWRREKRDNDATQT